MRAADVMTSEVITVDENASVQEAAKLMAAHGISAVPVVDRERRMVDMVSEGDLLHRAETGTERRRSWWLENGGVDEPARGGIRQVAQRQCERCSDARRDLGDRGNRGRRHRNSIGDEPYQARAGAARRQAGRDRQPGKPREGASDDNR